MLPQKHITTRKKDKRHNRENYAVQITMFLPRLLTPH
jgi:hypothetical protein